MSSNTMFLLITVCAQHQIEWTLSTFYERL